MKKCAGVWCKNCHSLSTIKLRTTLQVHTARSYAQFVCRTLNAILQKQHCKSIGATVALIGEIDP